MPFYWRSSVHDGIYNFAGYFYFFTGDFLKQTPPGKDVGYFYATLTFRL